MALLFLEDGNHEPKRAKLERSLVMGFSDEDKIGTIQPHNDALVIILRIGGYDVKRVMVDQGSVAEIVYPDLFRGLNLRAEDLTPYSSPLISFEGKVIILKGQIRLPVQAGSETVEVDFIVVDAYSIFSLYSNRCQTLASYFRSGLFNLTSEDQIPIRRQNRRNTG